MIQIAIQFTRIKCGCSESFSYLRFAMTQMPTSARLSKSDQRIADHCQCNESDEQFSVGIFHPSFSACEFSNEFMFWFPRGIPAGNSVAVSSSRMGQKLDEQTEWFDALRTLAVQIAQAPKFLMTAQGTSTDSFVRRLAKLFQIDVLEFIQFPSEPSSNWFPEQTNVGSKSIPHDTSSIPVFVKPLDHSVLSTDQSGFDDLLIGLAKSAFLLSVRNRGNIQKAARIRLDHRSNPPTRLLINRKLTPKSVESDLLNRGATAWYLYEPDDPGSDPIPESTKRMPSTRNSAAAICSITEFKTENYLAHWTRRRVGPWPDQNSRQYIDNLIFCSTERIHNEVSTLCRILAAGRILGSHGLTRDPRDVVCFSNVPLDQIYRRRKYRPHLARWDFEPYGIAIKQELLLRLGAQPVIYGDESTWKQTAESEQAFFQLRKSSSGEIDWSEEHEWRLVGDLNLGQIPRDLAVVFVKSKSDASIVSELSRWPVVILDDQN